MKLQEYIITKYRGVIVTLFLLPMSVILRTIIYIKGKFTLIFYSAPKYHDQRVQRIKDQLKVWRESGANDRLCTNRSPWKSMSELVPNYKSRYQKIDVGMHSILEIDEARGVVRVEPMVDMGQITAALNPKGWTLAIVPELDALTVGGLIMGFGVESSSHRFGLFQHICVSYDIITPDGEVLHCTKTENKDLFYSIPWSHGTLGFLVAAELMIIPAKKFVELRYEPTRTRQDLIEKFESASRNKADALFVEALTYSKDDAVLMTGRLVDDPPKGGKVNRLGRWHKPWFYKHVETYLKSGAGVEYIPLRQYYHRHTRSYFWEMRDIIPFGNQPWFRWLIGWAMPPHIQLLKRLQTPSIQKLRVERHIVQDMIMPMSKLDKSLDHFEEDFSLHPLWLCPLLIPAVDGDQGFLSPLKLRDGAVDELFVDVGAYGTPQVEGFSGNAALRRLEKFVIENHGYQALYARTLMTEDQFYAMFDHKQYERLRSEIPLASKAFDSVYTKVTKGRIAPFELKAKENAGDNLKTEAENEEPVSMN